MTQETQIAIRQVVVDLGRNTLVLLVDPLDEAESRVVREESSVIDMGTRGRLLGIELGMHYFAVAESDGSADDLVRSIEIFADVTRRPDGRVQSIEVPRHGPNYEVTFPIGNQCWRQTVNGQVVESCVVTVSRDA